MKIDLLMNFAERHCRKAGMITLEYFQKEFSVELKKDLSPVTIADRRSEELLRSAIENEFPEDGIIGEEFGEKAGRNDREWYIDPIDGTLAFTRGVPIYGVMLGLRAAKEYVIGCVFLPALNEMVIAGKGEGCFWNGTRASVSRIDSLKNAVFVHSGYEYFSQYQREATYRKLEAATKLQRTWGDCYGHILVATGRADICVDPILFRWDAAPLIPILQEAGGTFTDWQGTTTHDAGEGMSTNKLLLPELLNSVRT